MKALVAKRFGRRKIEGESMLQKSVLQFLESGKAEGALQDRAELLVLNERLDGLIPSWYIDLLATIPIAGLHLGWQAFPPNDDFNGIEEITMLDLPLLAECNLESFPGVHLWVNGYFTFGYGASWAGNCFIFKPDEGPNPPVYEVWHDAAHDPQAMLVAIEEKAGVRLVANSFSELFDAAVEAHQLTGSQ